MLEIPFKPTHYFLIAGDAICNFTPAMTLIFKQYVFHRHARACKFSTTCSASITEIFVSLVPCRTIVGVTIMSIL